MTKEQEKKAPGMKRSSTRGQLNSCESSGGWGVGGGLACAGWPAPVCTDRRKQVGCYTAVLTAHLLPLYPCLCRQGSAQHDILSRARPTAPHSFSLTLCKPENPTRIWRTAPPSRTPKPVPPAAPQLWPILPCTHALHPLNCTVLICGCVHWCDKEPLASAELRMGSENRDRREKVQNGRPWWSDEEKEKAASSGQQVRPLVLPRPPAPAAPVAGWGPHRSSTLSLSEMVLQHGEPAGAAAGEGQQSAGCRRLGALQQHRHPCAPANTCKPVLGWPAPPCLSSPADLLLQRVDLLVRQRAVHAAVRDAVAVAGAALQQWRGWQRAGGSQEALCSAGVATQRTSLATQLCKLPLVSSHSNLHPPRHLTVLGCVKLSMSFTSSARSPATLRTISHLQGEGPAGQGRDERWLCAQPAMLVQVRGNSRWSNRQAGDCLCTQLPALCFAAALPPSPTQLLTGCSR